jgi:hypothetical protein
MNIAIIKTIRKQTHMVFFQGPWEIPLPLAILDIIRLKVDTETLKSGRISATT